MKNIQICADSPEYYLEIKLPEKWCSRISKIKGENWFDIFEKVLSELDSHQGGGYIYEIRKETDRRIKIIVGYETDIDEIENYINIIDPLFV